MKFYPAYILLFILSSCANEPSEYKELKKIDWLIGKWENNSSDGNYVESWKKSNDSVFSGQSFIIQNNDTLFSEKLSLEYSGHKLNYIPVISTQNDGKPVSFELVSMTDSNMIFENTTHDFPQKITYTLINKDSLIAEISGNANGNFRSESFSMKRAK